MVEVEVLGIASLGLVILIVFYLLFDKLKDIETNERPLNETEIERITNLVLDREATKLKQGNTEEISRMKDQVGEVKTENVTIRDLVAAVSTAQETTASAVETSTGVSQKVANALGGSDTDVKRIYGEERARSILTFADLREGEHFLVQPPLAPYEGNPNGKEPDFAIILPGGGALAIDSKTITKHAFNAYRQLDSEEDDAEKKRLLHEHSKAVWGHVKLLAERNYPLGLEQSYGKGPDYTLMFIPNDDFLYRAERGVSSTMRTAMGFNTLREAAIRRRVFLCSPDSLAMKAIDVMDHWKSASKLEDVNDVLELVQDVTEAIVHSEDKKAAHHKSMKGAVESWNEYVNETEGTHGRRSRPSLRVSITSLFEKVKSKQVHSSGRGKKGMKMEPQPLDEISASIKGPTATKAIDMHTSARLEEAYVEEEE
jgi:DNA anti-recombination protein RmuC